MSELKIYKASAGSGKTYRLTGDYIDLLFENPRNYKNILAVTFTNKASAEMKSRIVSELFTLASGKKSGYSDSIKQKYNLDNEKVKQVASDCLAFILHDYSKFSVETIDRFFQKIIISFIREIGLQTGFSLELDLDSVLQEVTDKMLYDLDEDEQLKKWLINYAEDKVEEGKSWNFKNDIITLGKELFKESFKISRNAIVEKTSDKGFLKAYIKDIKSHKKALEEELSEYGKSALECLNSFNLAIEDLSQGNRGIGGLFYKLSIKTIPESLNSYVLKCIDNPDAWCTAKSNKKNEIKAAVSAGLMDILYKINNFYNEKLPAYNTVNQVLKYLPVLGIVTDLSKRIREHTDENNSFLISDAAEFLFQITGQNESPFIYEKTGTYYKYFMIDEFQDTSRLQWHNFHPLILNSLSDNNSALLVGDVKQSIYRWRNSDWKILAEEVSNSFTPFSINEISLNSNWRSKPNIINFNNAAFKIMSQNLQNLFNQQVISEESNQRIINVYSQLEQKFPSEKNDTGGKVEIQFLLKDEYRDEAKKIMLERIEELQDKGFKLKDIAILVRNKKDGKEIAEYLINHNNQSNSNYKFDVISNDSLFISNNKAVQVLIYALKYLKDPKDILNLFTLVYEYIGLDKDKRKDISLDFTDKEATLDQLKKHLPSNFDEVFQKLKAYSVYDMVEYLTGYFNFSDTQEFHPYLQAFKDLIFDFTLNKTAHLSSFLDWWELIGKGKTIAINEEQDAIKIITIHKSKGLQYKAVLIPFCNWDLDHNPVLTNILWCTPTLPPFNQLEKIPVRYSSQLSNTIFYKEYEEEKLQTFVDNINLLYVAFTRAEEYLYVSCQKEENKDLKIKSVSDLLLLSFQTSSDEKVLKPNWESQSTTYIYGTIPQQTNREEEIKEVHINKYTSIPLFERFEFTKQAQEYFNSDKKSESKIEYGKLMHRIFQMIYKKTDLSKAINTLKSEGLIDKRDIDIININIKKTISKKEVVSWFDGSYNVINEADIILDKEVTYRPDRIMEKGDEVIIVDYKFGEKEENKHLKQVSRYAGIVKSMKQASNISAYLWYVDLDKIKKVEYNVSMGR